MIPYIIISICLVLAILIFVYADDYNKPFGFVFFIPVLLALAVMDLNPKDYKLYKVNYKIFKTPEKIICITDNGTFESDKINDLENWNETNQGYLILGYNYFGVERTRNFTTKPFDKNLIYTNTNEHR